MYRILKLLSHTLMIIIPIHTHSINLKEYFFPLDFVLNGGKSLEYSKNKNKFFLFFSFKLIFVFEFILFCLTLYRLASEWVINIFIVILMRSSVRKTRESVAHNMKM